MTMSLVSLALFALMTHFLRHYQSEGFLRATRPLTEFNAQRSSIEDKDNFLRYLRANKLSDTPNAAYVLQAIGPDLMLKRVKVVLPYSKEDLKLLADLKSPLESNILGFTISFPGASPDDAAARVKLVGDYLKDTMLRQDLLESIHLGAGDARAEKQKLNNKLIAKRVELDEATRKLNALKEIAAKYPEASKYEARQLLSSDTDGSRYLSPVMQLVGVESNIADIRNDLVSLERDAAQNDVRLKFYADAEKLNPSVKSGRELFEDFKTLRANTFKDTRLDDDRVREVVNKIDLLAETLQTKHLVNTRFVSGPSAPDHRAGPRIGSLLVLSLVLGGLFAGAAVAAMGWVRTHKGGRSVNGLAEPGVQL
ncbi:LPS O-antigen subunit length determinant protein (WzzB/FepE family) [Cupriavidus metallidurans]